MRRRHPVLIALLLTATVGPVRDARATQPYGQPPLGPRAIGLGGAYTAIADDASALHWNPAGLIGLDHQEIAASHAALYGGDLRDDHVALAVPLSLKHALALGWYRSGIDDSELGFAENRVDLSWACRPARLLSLGATVKLLTQSTKLEGLEIQGGRGFGADFGIMFVPGRRLRAGLVAQNLMGTRLHSTGEPNAERVYDSVVRAGLSFQATPWLLSAVDLDDRLHLGAEIALRDEVSVRAGLQDEAGDGLGPVYAVGAGIRAGGLRIDVAREMHPDLGGTYHLGLAYGFQLNPARLRVEKVEADDLYASLARSYAGHSFGRAWIRNLDDEEILARVSVHLPGVLKAPAEQEVLLRPGVLNPVELTAVFPDDVVLQPGDRDVRIEVTAAYRSARVVRSDRGGGRSALYGAGAVNWARGIDQIGAFVTTLDPVVDGLAREAVRALDAEDRQAFGTREMAATAAVVTTLSTMGFRYIPDPHNPYSEVSGERHAVDNVRYPRETLGRRSGDCDDTVVLLAALLANVGVPTRVVDVPGHLFLLADAGLRASNREALLVDSTLVLVRDDRVWIPLETTSIGSGFREVWAAGARSCRSWEALGELRLVDVGVARRRYASLESALPPAPSPEIDADRLSSELSRLSGDQRAAQQAYLETRYGRALTSPDAPIPLRMAAARALYLSGRLEAARDLLEAIDQAAPSARAANNLGVVCLALADTAGAGRALGRALLAAPEDPGIWLNLGLLRFLEGDMPAAKTAIARAVGAPGGREEVSSRLGFSSSEQPTRAGGLELTLDKLRSLVRYAFRVPESEAAVLPSAPAGADSAAAEGLAGTTPAGAGATPAPARVAGEPPAGVGTTPAPARVAGEPPAAPGPGSPGSVAIPAAPETLGPSLDLIMVTARADEPARVQHFLYWKER